MPFLSPRLKGAVRLLPFLVCLMMPSVSFSHAVVTESSLAKEAIKAHHPTKVVLLFNANVELALSRVFLVSAGDIFHPAEISRGHRAGELLIQLPALEPGDYAIKYKVFAADGHLTENNIRFHVAP